jgi:hypothetical protein
MKSYDPPVVCHFWNESGLEEHKGASVLHLLAIGIQNTELKFTRISVLLGPVLNEASKYNLGVAFNVRLNVACGFVRMVKSFVEKCTTFYYMRLVPIKSLLKCYKLHSKHNNTMHAFSMPQAIVEFCSLYSLLCHCL